MLADVGSLDWQVGSLDTIPKETIPSKCGPNSKQFLRRTFLNIFPIGSYVKTMSSDWSYVRTMSADWPSS